MNTPREVDPEAHVPMKSVVPAILEEPTEPDEESDRSPEPPVEAHDPIMDGCAHR